MVDRNEALEQARIRLAEAMYWLEQASGQESPPIEEDPPEDEEPPPVEEPPIEDEPPIEIVDDPVEDDGTPSVWRFRDHFEFVGGIALPKWDWLNYSDMAIAVYDRNDGRHAIIPTHRQDNFLLRWKLPEPGGELNKPDSWPEAVTASETIDWNQRAGDKWIIRGLLVDDKKRLHITRYRAYDAEQKYNSGHGYLSNVDALKTAAHSGWLDSPGPKSTGIGWISRIPDHLQLGGSVVYGSGAGWSIIGRDTMGPSAYVGGLHPVSTVTRQCWPYPQVMGIPDGVPQHSGSLGGMPPFDRWMSGGIEPTEHAIKVMGEWPWPGLRPDWSFLSTANYGFVAPDGKYICFGGLNGVRGGIGYKGPYKDETAVELPYAVTYPANGYARHDRSDSRAVSWVFDTADWGAVEPHRMTPICEPQNIGIGRVVTSGDWRPDEGLLYLTHGGGKGITVWRWKG